MVFLLPYDARMRTFIQILVAAAFGIGIGWAVAFAWPPSAINLDPNHNHADFSVWVNGQQLDFSDPSYMSAPPATAAMFDLVPSAVAHGDEDDGHVVSGREYLHLHNGNGHVIHRHKPGLTLGDFFTSIGLQMTAECLMLDDKQFSSLDQGWVSDFARTKNLCNDGKFHWTFVVNGEPRPMDPALVFADEDAILLSYSASDTAWEQQWAQMTDDACKYSKTCPWRGTPPTENCIADPTIPCTQ